ncbi:Uncharacterized protein FWK35_00031876, partial [Aphis craccivora]
MKYDNYFYVKNGLKRNIIIYFKCKETAKYTCHGSIKITGDSDVHLETLKKRSVNKVTTLNTIYEDEARQDPESAAKYTWKSAESCMRWCRRRSLPTVSGTLRELADQFQSGLLERYQSCGEVIYKGCVEDSSGNNSIVFASKNLILKALEMEITEMHVDASFRVVPSTPKSYHNARDGKLS